MGRRSDKVGGAKRVGACLPAFLTSALSSRIDEVSRLQPLWQRRVVGPLAVHARPVRYAAGLLYVHVDTPAWASRLRHERPALVAALRESRELADLADIRWRVVPREEHPLPVPRPPSGGARLSSKAVEAIVRTAPTIAYPPLRAALERLAAGGRRPVRKPAS